MNNKPQEPCFSRDVPLPVTPISPGDVAVIAEMMKGYLAFVRVAFRASAQRDAYVQYIEHLRRRLAGQYPDNTPLPLTLHDIETIEAAMSTFEVITTHMAHQRKSVMQPLLSARACVNASRVCALALLLVARRARGKKIFSGLYAMLLKDQVTRATSLMRRNEVQDSWERPDGPTFSPSLNDRKEFF